MAASATRLARLTRRGAWIMVPLDHGVSLGPAPGFADPARAMAAVAGHASCLAVHRGLVPLAARHAGDLGLLLHLSASTDAAPDPNDKRVVASVEDALRLGCDGVSLHVNVGSATEARQLEDAGRVASACAAWGVPLVTMAYPRGPHVADPREPRLVAHAARLAAELGADAVKVPYTGSPESFRQVVEGCPVPVLVAGGPRHGSFEQLLADLRGARRAGARGCSVGRHVVQHADPRAAAAAVAEVFAGA